MRRGGGEAVDPHRLLVVRVDDPPWRACGVSVRRSISLWSLGPTGFGIDYTQGENVSGDGDEGTSWGTAAVQRITPYKIDLYAQLRRYSLDGAADLDLKDITVGSFGTKFAF